MEENNSSFEWIHEVVPLDTWSVSLLFWLKGSQLFLKCEFGCLHSSCIFFIANPILPDRVFSPRIQDKVSTSFSLSNKPKPRHTHTKIFPIVFLPETEKIEDYRFRHLLVYIRYHISVSQYRDVEFVIFFLFLLYLQANKVACHGFLGWWKKTWD